MPRVDFYELRVRFFGNPKAFQTRPCGCLNIRDRPSRQWREITLSLSRKSVDRTEIDNLPEGAAKACAACSTRPVTEIHRKLRRELMISSLRYAMASTKAEDIDVTPGYQLLQINRRRMNLPRQSLNSKTLQ